MVSKIDIDFSITISSQNITLQKTNKIYRYIQRTLIHSRHGETKTDTQSKTKKNNNNQKESFAGTSFKNN